jgi:hypothetical protein
VHPELLSGSFQCDECKTIVKDVPQQFKYTEPKKCREFNAFYSEVLPFQSNLDVLLWLCKPPHTSAKITSPAATHPHANTLLLAWHVSPCSAAPLEHSHTRSSIGLLASSCHCLTHSLSHCATCLVLSLPHTLALPLCHLPRLVTASHTRSPIVPLASSGHCLQATHHAATSPNGSSFWTSRNSLTSRRFACRSRLTKSRQGRCPAVSTLSSATRLLSSPRQATARCSQELFLYEVHALLVSCSTRSMPPLDSCSTMPMPN